MRKDNVYVVRTLKITFHSPSSQSSTGLMRQENLYVSNKVIDNRTFFVHDSIIMITEQQERNKVWNWFR